MIRIEKIILTVILFSGVLCFAGNQKSNVIANINVAKIHLSSVLLDGHGTYSIVDDEGVILAEGKNLLIIKNNIITKKIKCPSDISTFDINKHGNGAIVSGSRSNTIMYRVKGFHLQSLPIKVNIPVDIPGAKWWSFIFDLSMIDDSNMRLRLNDPDEIILTDFDRIEKKKYTVLDDNISRYLSRNVTEYVGHYENEYYFFRSTAKDGIERIQVLKKDDIEKLMTYPWIKQSEMELSMGRIIELGDLGRRILRSNPVRLDESTGFFYVMLVQKGNLVIRKFDIKDLGSSVN